MIELFTALLVLSNFNPELPKPEDLQKMNNANLVKMYSSACLSFFKRSEFQGFDLPKLLQSVLQATKANPKENLIQSNLRTSEIIGFYNQICKANPDLKALDSKTQDLKAALNSYENLIDKMPAISDLKQLKLLQSTELLSTDKKIIGEIFTRENRRKSIQLAQLPAYVGKTFVAVEDARFYEHKGIDEVGILRALFKDFSGQGGRQGASTITQQVARNLYLGTTPSLQRKFQEILISQKIESQLSKNEILELYINLIYFGRNAWGIEKAAQAYFGKSAKDLTISETAFLAGIVHGPNLYRFRTDRIENRVQFVISRMKERSVVAANFNFDQKRDLKILPESDSYNAGYVRDLVIDGLRKVNPYWLGLGGLQIQTTIDSRMQALASEALQDGLISYERRLANINWDGPLDNINESVQKNAESLSQQEQQRKTEEEKGKESLFSALVGPAEKQVVPKQIEKGWYRPLTEISGKYPVPISKWRLAVVVGNGKKIGLLDGNERDLTPASLTWANSLKLGDVLFVQPSGRNQFEIVQPPQVNGAVVVLEPNTGRVLALSGGFSYLTSSYNRTLAMRQPGSLMKPFTYLTALQRGLQPNILLSDYYEGTTKNWIPKNYGGGNGPSRPMRWALENSRNVMTVNLAIQIGINPIRRMTESFGLYENPARDLSFVLGSQEVSLLNIVRSYAGFANGGRLVYPQLMDEISESPNSVLMRIPSESSRISNVDEIALFQLRYLLQGVVERGTAARLSQYSKYFAGKTGTTNDSKDVWFVGFTPHLVIGVYVGYDNPESLGAKVTGGAAALPVVERILTGSFRFHYFPELFPDPPLGVVFARTDRFTGELIDGPNSVAEAYRSSSLKETKP